MSSTEIWTAPLLSSAETALVGINTDGRVAFWSPGAETLFGWTAQEVMGRPPPIIPGALHQEWQLQMQRVLDSGQPTSLAETQRLTRSGQFITVARTSAPVKDASGRVVGLVDVLTDATALKQLDDESRALVQVRERELIAMDLHDGMIQSLYALVLNLAAHELTLTDTDSVEAVHGARVQIERVIAETRSYLFSLRDRAFIPRNLQSGLRLLVDSLRLNAGLQVSLEFDPGVEPALSPEARGHLLYLLREASSNILRHADATSVTISLQHMPEAVVITVSDNGRGFEQPEAIERHHGLGNMAERARLIGGRLSITSAPGQGTAVRVELPL